MERRKVVRDGEEVVVIWTIEIDGRKLTFEDRLSLDEADVFAADVMRARMGDQPPKSD